MPSQEFYAILEMIIHPDVIDPRILRGDLDQNGQSTEVASKV